MPAGVAAAQHPPPVTLAYTATQLACARFSERSRGTLDTQVGGTRRRETLLREGSWIVRAAPAADSSSRGALSMEAWLDSLVLERQSPAGTLVPDTDGLLGGRYRGTLTPTGTYLPEARPFVPDEVAEVAELGAAAEDLLPPLPPVALRPGEEWSNRSGLTLRRLPDSTAGHTVIYRLALESRQEADRASVRGDSVAVPARELTSEDGEVDWAAGAGLIRRLRHIVVQTSVPAGGVVRVPVRSRLEQDVVLTRSGKAICPAD